MLIFLSLCINVILLVLILSLRRRLKKYLDDYENMVNDVIKLRKELLMEKGRLILDRCATSDLKEKQLADTNDDVSAMKPQPRT